MMERFPIHKDRVAVVTGADRGIGAAIAIALAKSGACVVAVDLEEPTATVETTGAGSRGLIADVSDLGGWAEIARAAEDAFGPVDIVVNNAAYDPNRRIDDLDLETWRRTLSVNMDAHFLSARQFMPSMRQREWGRLTTDAAAFMTGQALVADGGQYRVG